MSAKTKVVHYGCGPIGCSIARLAVTRPDIEIVGAIDLVNVSCDLGEVANMRQKIGVTISDDADTVFNHAKPDIVLHATGSVFNDIYPQLEKAVKAGANLISTCEELSYPYRKHPELAAKLDQLCKEHQVTALGTGVNPGFAMDTWPLAMTAVCQDIQKIKVMRVQDASTRRLPFQKKIGAGKTIKEFEELAASGVLRHVGLEESIAMIAAGLGWELDDITETIEPIVAEAALPGKFLTVKAGQVAGVKQLGSGLRYGKKLIVLDFQAFIGAKESYDAVYITGTPDMQVVIKGGIHGDIATAAIIINAIRKVIDAPPGLTTMKDLPIVCALRGNADY